MHQEIRRMALVGDSGHGKTALLHALQRNAGVELEAKDESTSRSPTEWLSTTHVAAFEIVDTPGRVAFGGEVEAALALVDGVLLVVDCIDGVGVQCERIIQRLLERSLRPVLFINKIDKAINGDGDILSNIHVACSRVINAVNAVVSRYVPHGQQGWRVNLADDTVLFGSALGGWGFTMSSFAAWHACREGESTATLLDSTSHDFSDHEHFSLFSLLSKLFEVPIRPPCIAAPVSPPTRWDSSGPLVVHVVRLLEDQKSTSAARQFIAVGRVISGTLTSNQQVTVAVRSFEPPPSSSTVQRLVKPAFPPRVRLSAPYLTPSIEHSTVSIGAVGFVDIGVFFESVDGISAGNICAICGLDGLVLRSAVLIGDESMDIGPYAHLLDTDSLLTRPTARTALRVQTDQDAEAIERVLVDLSRMDLTVGCSKDYYNSLDFQLAGVNHRHVQHCLDYIQAHASSIVYDTADIIPCYRETVTTLSSEVCPAKSPNKHLRFYCTAEPLDEHISQVTDLKIIHRSVQDSTRYSQLADKTRGHVARIQEVMPWIQRGYQWATATGVLCEEPLHDIQVNLVDVFLKGPSERHWRPIQVILATRRAMAASQWTASPRLLEPWLLMEIKCSPDSFASVLSTLDTADTVHLSVDSHSPALRVCIRAAAVDQVQRQLEAAIEGTLAIQTALSHYVTVEGDPFDPKTSAGTLVLDVRAWKRLEPLTIPPLETWRDKL